MPDEEILTYLIESGKIDLAHVRAEIAMREKQEILKNHKYDFWQNKNGQWLTYLPDPEKGRVQRKRNKREDLEDLVIKFYKENEDNPTVGVLLLEWMDRKIDNKDISEQTYTRYLTDFKRFFIGTGFDKKKVSLVTEVDIEDFLKKCVHDYELNRKAYSNLRTLVYGVFKYAKKKRYIDWRIKEAVDDIEFGKKEFKTVIHSDEEIVFSIEEEEKITDELKNNLDIINLGILLIFTTGLRIGELVALKPCDINGNTIHVHATEIFYKDRKTGKYICTVQDTTKTPAGDRHVIVPDHAMWILKRIQMQCQFAPWLFYRDNRRVNEQCFRRRLNKMCKAVNIVPKSPHKVRRTYGSKLLDANLPEIVITQMMGHTNIKVTKDHYYANRYSDARKADLINAAGI